MKPDEHKIQRLAQHALERLQSLEAEQQCQLGELLLRDLLPHSAAPEKALIDHTQEVMAKFPNFARARAAVLLKALKTLSTA